MNLAIEMIRVKICGIRRVEDAKLAVNFGADAVGVLVGQRHSSNDFLSPTEAVAIVGSLPPFISSVLVTHLEEADDLIELIRTCEVSTVQIHSPMAPSGLERIRTRLNWIRIIKSIHVIDERSVLELSDYNHLVDAFLLDSINLATNQVGGTGKTHDWKISRDIVSQAQRPVILAGGLTPKNVSEAVRIVSPFGVDVNTGTKGPDGFKDPDKVGEFIFQAKRSLFGPKQTQFPKPRRG